MTSALSSQRFCLRWNNHQSNLLTVFDQLLHDESFVDVTLAVEGRLLKAHKMVLSACSPYFQALFVGHPDRHPIVILKDVPYCDMKSLLDFMYRGEVSVDQERLTAFLKVAESLRIKGLTEVNEEKYDLPSIASSLLSSVSPPVVTTHTPPPPPHLHRIHTIPSHRRNLAVPSATPLLGSALTAPKRKRGRPRKLSGSSAGAQAAAGDGAAARKAPVGNGDVDGVAKPAQVAEPAAAQTLPPEMLEVRMSVDFQQSGASGGRPPDGDIGNDVAATTTTEPSPDQADTQQKESSQPPAKKIKEEVEPTPGPSSQDPGEVFSRQSGATPTDSEQFSQDVNFTSILVEERPSITFELCGPEPTYHRHGGGPPGVVMDGPVEEHKMGLVTMDAAAPGVHFLSHEAEDGAHECILVAKCEEADSEDLLLEGAGRGRQELLEYLVREDGSVVCKWCGEVLPTRTHWYRHKYKFHVAATFQPPASLFKCHRCNVFFKSRKGYTGHVANRHAEGDPGREREPDAAEEPPGAADTEPLPPRPTRRTRGADAGLRGDEYQSQREKEEKLVADIIDRVRRECEAQGATVTRRGYSRRSTVMNS